MNNTSQTWFWHDFYGWCLGLGFILLVILISIVAVYVTGDEFQKRKLERQRHRHKMKRMKQEAALIHKGIDPEYVRFLEEKLDKTVE